MNNTKVVCADISNELNRMQERLRELCVRAKNEGLAEEHISCLVNAANALLIERDFFNELACDPQ